MREKITMTVAITAPELWFIGQISDSEKETIPETAPSFREYYY
jgi:hypothetical protein